MISGAFGALAAIMAYKASFRSPDVAAESWHEDSGRFLDLVPYRIGDWVGSDVEAPGPALAADNPETMVSRRYENLKTGHSARLLTVHCSDRQHLEAYSPRVLYSALGWNLVSAKLENWSLPRRPIQAVEYEFSR